MLPKIINNDQTGFLKNRFIGENIRLAASSRPRRKVAALLGSGNTFPVFRPTGFMVFRIRQWSQACEFVLESYRLKYCERVRYSESSLLLPNKPHGIYLSVVLCCVVEQKLCMYVWMDECVFIDVFIYACTIFVCSECDASGMAEQGPGAIIRLIMKRSVFSPSPHPIFKAASRFMAVLLRLYVGVDLQLFQKGLS